MGGVGWKAQELADSWGSRMVFSCGTKDARSQLVKTVVWVQPFGVVKQLLSPILITGILGGTGKDSHVSGVLETWNVKPRLKVAFAWEDESGVERVSFCCHAFNDGDKLKVVTL